MQIAVWQIVIITVLAFLYRIERYGTQVTTTPSCMPGSSASFWVTA